MSGPSINTGLTAAHFRIIMRQYDAICSGYQRFKLHRLFLMPRQPLNNRISVGLSDTEHETLRRIAEESHVSLAWLGRRAIVEFLERHDSKGMEVLRMDQERTGNHPHNNSNETPE